METRSRGKKAGYLYDLDEGAGDDPWRETRSSPVEGDTDGPFGYAIYEDGTAFPFYREAQYAAYLGVTEMCGCMFDHGRGWHGLTEHKFHPCRPAELARERHQREHGEAVFVCASDFELTEDDEPRTQPLEFSEAKALAVEAMAMDVCARRRSCGYATVTARKSTGAPAPRRPAGMAFGLPNASS